MYCGFSQESLQTWNQFAFAYHDTYENGDIELDTLRSTLEETGAFGLEALIIVMTALSDFKYIPDICTKKEYGKWLIDQNDHYYIDPDIEDYFDYTDFAEDHTTEEDGVLIAEGGYLVLPKELRGTLKIALMKKRKAKQINSTTIQKTMSSFILIFIIYSAISADICSFGQTTPLLLSPALKAA